MLSCEGYALLEAGARVRVLVDQFEARTETGAVGDLDGQTGAGIELENQWALSLVENEVYPR